MSHDLFALFSNAPLKIIDANQVLFHAGDAVQSLYFVKKGVVVLERQLKNGDITCLQRATDESILAEASLYATHYHCDARALEQSYIHCLSIKDFKLALVENAPLGNVWAEHLARAVQKARLLSEIRGLKTVAARLDAWLGEHGTLPEKGMWQTLAAELAVSREALYRELASRTPNGA